MTELHSSPPPTADMIAARVRSNAVSSLLPAVLITVIGWLMPASVSKDPPELKETTIVGMIWTLRVVGPLLLVTAALGRTGALWCFLLDAILSSCVALALAVTVVVIFDELLQGSVNVLVFAVFAAVYGRAAWSLGNEFFVRRRALGSAGTQPAVLAPAPSSSAGTVVSTAHEFERPRPSPSPEARRPSGRPPEPMVETLPPTPEEPPPDGFLAGFADRRPGEDEER